MSLAMRRGAASFPAAETVIPPSDQATMDAAVGALQARKDAWVAVPVAERAALVERLIRDFDALASRWVDANLRARGIAPDDPTAEEWVMGPYTVLRTLRQLAQSLREIGAGGRPRVPGPVVTRPDGQVTAQVFPRTRYDQLLYPGVRAAIWMQPEVTAESLPATMALAYNGEPHAGAVTLVLGAGNVSSIGPTDALYKLFVEDRVVLYKCNPINAYIGPLMEEAFRALIERGALRVVYGGAAEGAYLCQHAGVDEIHITGSDKSFETIVFGGGAEGEQRLRENRPLLTKPITGELSNISPVIVVPGPWSASDIAYQAEHLATTLVLNAGFNCTATRLILTQAGWGQREALLRALRAALARIPTRKAYYPGARERMDRFLAAHPRAERIGEAPGDHLPWTLVTDLDSRDTSDICFTTEAFCGLFSEVALDATDPVSFIERAVAFCNDEQWGSLLVTLLAHPSSLRDPVTSAAIERAVADLHYGTVGLNFWAGASFPLGETTWGAFPGHALNDIQSGRGVVHNTLMFARPRKSVLRGPFRATPAPPWFALHARQGIAAFPRLCALEARPSPLRLPGIFKAAFLG